MATAVLRIDRGQTYGYYIPNRRLLEEVKKVVSLPRDHVPPQLPQLPLDIWQALWDDFIYEYIEYVTFAKEAACCVPKDVDPTVERSICCFVCLINIFCPISVCAVCKLNTAANKMHDKILHKHRPLLSPHSIGLDIFFQINRAKDGPDQIKNGFVLSSAAAVVAAAVPVMPTMPVAPAAQEMQRGYGAATVVPVNSAPAADRLSELKSLLDKGLINENEYENKKRDIMASL